MITATLAGAVAGFGLYLFTRVLMRPKPGIATLLARIESGNRSMRTHTVSALEGASEDAKEPSLMDRLGEWFDILATDRGWRLGRSRADLALMNRSVGNFLATKVVLGLVLFLLAPVLWLALSLFGVPTPPAISVAAALLFGLFGFFLPDLTLRGEAGERRREFRRTVGIFLDLVAMSLGGGRGLPEALTLASAISEQWAVVRIRQSLANARLYGTTPWVALGQLGHDIDVEELRDLSAALALAADDGAKIRQSLSSRAATIRRRELSDAAGDAGEKSQSMLVAQLVLCFAFIIFLIFPAISQLTGQ